MSKSRKKAPGQGVNFKPGFDPRRNVSNGSAGDWQKMQRALKQMTLDRIKEFLERGDDLSELVASKRLSNLEYIVAHYILRLRNELRETDFDRFLGLLGIEYKSTQPQVSVQINNSAQIESMTDNELEAEVKKLQGEKNGSITGECKRIENSGATDEFDAKRRDTESEP